MNHKMDTQDDDVFTPIWREFLPLYPLIRLTNKWIVRILNLNQLFIYIFLNTYYLLDFLCIFTHFVLKLNQWDFSK